MIKSHNATAIFLSVSFCICQFLFAEDIYFNNFEDKDDISFWACGYPAFFGSLENAEQQKLLAVNSKGLSSTFEGGKANSGVRAFKLDITLPEKGKDCSWNYWCGPKLKIPLDKAVYLSGYIYAERLPPDVEVSLGWNISGVSKDGRRIQSNKKISNGLKTSSGWMFFQADIKKEAGNDWEGNPYLDSWYLHINSENAQFHGQRIVFFLDDVKISTSPVMESGTSGKYMNRSEVISDDPYVVNYKSFFQENPSSNHNLCNNSSFETGMKNWEVQGDCEFFLDDKNARHGSKSLKIQITDPNADISLNSRPVQVAPGEDYTISFYAKSDRDYTLKAGRISLILDKTWKRYILPLKHIKASEPELYSIMIKAKGAGNIWIDAVQIEKGNITDYSIPTTLEIGLHSNKKDNIFYPGETIVFDFNAFNSTDQELISGIKYQVTDFRKKIVSSGNFDFHIIPGTGYKKSIVLDLPLGYYKIKATLDSKGIQSKSEELSFGIITPVSNDKAGVNAFFGMAPFTPGALEGKLFAKESGVKYGAIYNTLYWRDAPPNWKEKNPQWENADRKLEKFRKLGVIPVMGLWGIPLWTGISNVIPKTNTELSDEIIQGWHDYTYSVATRYKYDIKHWIIWGEFMRDPLNVRASMYIRLLKAAASAIRKADPKAVIVGFGEDTARKEGDTWSLIPQLEAHFKLGSLDYVDAVGLDSYTYPASPESMEFGKMLDVLKETIRKYNHGRDKDIWITEVGVKGLDTLYSDLHYTEGASYPSFVTELEQAEDIVRMNLIAKAKGVKKFLTFPGGLASVTSEFPYGLVNYNGTSPKCAYVAYNHMVNRLINAEFKREIKTGDKTICYEFRSGDETTVAIWNYDSSHKPLTLILPIDQQTISEKILDFITLGQTSNSSNGIRVTNMVGTPIGFPSDSKWIITGSPLYFTATDETAAKKIPTAFEEAKIEEVLMNTHWNENGIIVSLKNKTSDQWKGQVTIDAPAELKYSPLSYDYDIPAREEKQLPFFISADCKNPLDNKVTIRAQGTDTPLINEIKPIFCPFIRDKLDIHDDFEKWRTGKSIRLGRDARKSASSSEWGGEKDLSALVYSAWNKEGFHLGVEVTDDIPSYPFQNPPEVWQNDALQLAFDPLCDATGNDSYLNDDIEYTFSMDARGNAIKHCTTNHSANIKEIRIDIKRNMNKIQYKIFFPWSVLGGFNPKEKRNFGFNLTVMDNDGDIEKYPKNKGFNQWLQLSDGLCGGKRPASFRNIILQGPQYEKKD